MVPLSNNYGPQGVTSFLLNVCSYKFGKAQHQTFHTKKRCRVLVRYMSVTDYMFGKIKSQTTLIHQFIWWWHYSNRPLHLCSLYISWASVVTGRDCSYGLYMSAIMDTDVFEGYSASTIPLILSFDKQSLSQHWGVRSCLYVHTLFVSANSESGKPLSMQFIWVHHLFIPTSKVSVNHSSLYSLPPPPLLLPPPPTLYPSPPKG